MSFTLSRTLDSSVAYPELGLTDTSTSESKTVDVAYEAIRLDSLIGTTARVVYTTRVGNSDAIFNEFEFEYSGTGNPLLEAETALHSALSN